MKKPFKETKAFGLIKGLLQDGLQSVPVVGTIVTNLKTDTKENPAGKLKLTAWDGYRLVIGAAIVYALHKGVSKEIITFVLEAIGL